VRRDSRRPGQAQARRLDKQRRRRGAELRPPAA